MPEIELVALPVTVVLVLGVGLSWSMETAIYFGLMKRATLTCYTLSGEAVGLHGAY